MLEFEYAKSDFLKQFISIMPEKQLYALLNREAHKFRKMMLDLSNSDFENGPRYFGNSQKYEDLVNFFHALASGNTVYKQELELAEHSSLTLFSQVLEPNYKLVWDDFDQHDKKIEVFMNVYLSHTLFLCLVNEYKATHPNLPSFW